MQIAVPVPRPSSARYEGRHRAPEPPPEIPRQVGEGTRDRRPYTLDDWEGRTRHLIPTPQESARIRAAAGAW